MKEAECQVSVDHHRASLVRSMNGQGCCYLSSPRGNMEGRRSESTHCIQRVFYVSTDEKIGEAVIQE